MTKEKAQAIISDYQGIVIRSKFKIDKPFIDKAINLHFIARAGAGMENIDVEYAQQKGIICLNSPEGNRDAVAEHAIGMLLSLLNKIYTSNTEVKSGIWNRNANWGITLQGKTVGIIGFGNTGKAFAQRLVSFGVAILAHDKYKSGFATDNIHEVSLDFIKDNADIISLHIPLTEETNYLINDSFIKTTKKPFYLINTARGKNVHTEALVAGIECGKILGACLDVLEYENLNFESLSQSEIPKPLHYLLTSEKVLLTPHVAGWTHESYRKHSEILAEKIKY